jgi:hypothetical protein
MKAININGNIKIYNQLPKTWGNIIGGFDTLDESEIQEVGFYDLVEPEYTPSIQNLINLHFDSDNNVFTYDVENKTFTETVAELKETKIDQLKDYTNNKLAKTDWYVIRKFERNINIPQDVQDSRAAILTNHDTKLDEINALTTKADIVSYEFE